MTVEWEYLKVIRARFESVKKLGDGAIQQVTKEEVHWQPNEASNSIAIIVKHLSGNMISRWTDFLTTDGEKPDRNREQEFQDTISSLEQLYSLWEEGWATVFDTLNTLQTDDLLKTVVIRGEKHSVIDALERQLAHYAYHVGQMIYIGKQLKGVNWASLSIPVGKSEAYLQEMLKKHNAE
ncbi:DUF1572 family protein [Lysinibacillus sp. KU-BSD001]|uniref:DUF1572 family protein n=1 Tax=Lysinibacillus sp. KU-BSD001 TaxID=3141328 RepID=UPI0036EE9C08